MTEKEKRGHQYVFSLKEEHWQCLCRIQEDVHAHCKISSCPLMYNNPDNKHYFEL